MELLIKEVKENPLLYNSNLEDYNRSSKAKNKIWMQIAKKLSYSNVNSVKDKWNKLRDCHRDALRRLKRSKMGQAGPCKKMWRYQKHMDFLLPFMRTASLALEDDDRESIRDDIKFDDQLTVSDIGLVPKHDELDVSSSCEKSQSSIDVPREGSPREDNAIKGNDTTTQEEDDSLYYFFMSLYNTTKAMPKSLQLQVKKNLFGAVANAEEIMLDRRGSWNSTRISNFSFGDSSQTAQDAQLGYQCFK